METGLKWLGMCFLKYTNRQMYSYKGVTVEISHLLMRETKTGFSERLVSDKNLDQSRLICVLLKIHK